MYFRLNSTRPIDHPTLAIISSLLSTLILPYTMSSTIETTAHGFQPDQGARSPWYYFIPKSGRSDPGGLTSDGPDYDGPFLVSELSKTLGARASSNAVTGAIHEPGSLVISRAAEKPSFKIDLDIDMKVCDLQISSSAAGRWVIEPIGGDQPIKRHRGAPIFPHRDWMINEVRARCSAGRSPASRPRSHRRPASPTHLGTQPESVSKGPTPERSLAECSGVPVGSSARPHSEVQCPSSSATATTAAWKPSEYQSLQS
jgi:hypothetical protein